MAADGSERHLFAVEHRIDSTERAARNGHWGGVVWLTGLSGSGKSTIALELERRLFAAGYQVYALDGDNVRHGLNRDLGFSAGDREENIRRVGEVAALMAGAGLLVITSFISPYRADRAGARAAMERYRRGAFHEIHVAASLELCEARDPKGLYRKARAGELADFTGISAPYEAPGDPELTVDTGGLSVEESLQLVYQYVLSHFGYPLEAVSGA